ncbi:MAG: ABC transporter ATP-binding protein [Clostridia bacterium]|nr:ABC transporter ATP-binding protein [Clostridia bacterium]
MKNSIIRLENISKTYGDTKVLNELNLSIKKNEFLTLLGPSGCGKTTTLKIIGGFETPDEGNVYFEEQCINTLPPYKRKLNTVFQKYALFPNMNVFENIAFGLRIKKLPSLEIESCVKDVLNMVNLNGFEKRDISSLSGGQQQRVAIARAIVNKPDVLLLDEPLGALDLKLRKDMQIELKNIQKQLGITFIYVTHDQEEALTMSDTIVVMNNGLVQQIGSPVDIYNEPQNAFVADFIGESIIVDGIMHEDFVVEFIGHKFECLDKGFDKMEAVDVVIRPEDVKIVEKDAGKFNVVIDSVTFKGVHYEMVAHTDNVCDTKWLIHSTQKAVEGSTVGINLEPNDIHIMKKLSAEVGDSYEEK